MPLSLGMWMGMEKAPPPRRVFLMMKTGAPPTLAKALQQQPLASCQASQICTLVSVFCLPFLTWRTTCAENTSLCSGKSMWIYIIWKMVSRTYWRQSWDMQPKFIPISWHLMWKGRDINVIPKRYENPTYHKFLEYYLALNSFHILTMIPTLINFHILTICF